MQRQYQKDGGKAKISPSKVPSAKSEKHLPKASPAKPRAKEPLVVSLNDENFSSLLMHNDIDLLEGMKDDEKVTNFAELLDGAFSDQIQSDPGKPVEKKRREVKKVRRVPQRQSRADQTISRTGKTTSRTDHAKIRTGQTTSRTDHAKIRTGQTTGRTDHAKIRTGPTKSRVGQTESLADQTISWADQTLAIATSMFRPPREQSKSQADQTTSRADQTLLSGVASIFRPVREVRLEEDEDLYFGKEGRVNVDYSIMQTAPATKYSLLVFFFCVGVALCLGWLVRGEELLSAESGLGYNLGIVGGSMMLVLVFYPLRKKYSSLKFLGPPKLWFYLHMVFGTLGPALILFHANFSVGSFNSQVALTFTMLVAVSGFFHMYIYTKIHYRLHGKKMTLQELQKKTEVNRSSLNHIFDYAPKLKQRLHEFEEEVLAPPLSVLESVLRVLTIGFRIRLNYLIIIRGLKRGLEIVFERAGWPASELEGQHQSNKKIVKEHMKAILKIVELSFYERLFAQWYLFHGPLFFMLIFVAIIHVIAVHMY